MKGKIILPFFLLILLFTTAASASIFDWAGWITGNAAEEEQTTPLPAPVVVEEQVTCLFANSDSEQKCYGDAFSCAGTGSCTVKVSGDQGKQIGWKSTCEGYAYTTIDGNNENAEFKCETLAQPAAQPPTSTSESTPILQSKEQVKCVFANSASAQKCYTDDGRFGCSGTGSCIVDVVSNSGAKLAWKSSCSGYAYTTIDGNNENAEFKCESISAIPPCGNGACESGETCSSCPADCGQCATQAIQEAKEQVKCVFANSNLPQICYSSDGRYKCSGTGSCLLDVYGAMGTKLEWKSSCSGYAYTFIDGKNDYAEFKCETATAPTPAATTATTIQTQTVTSATQTAATPVLVKEQAKCIFANSASAQKCYTDDGRFGCSGTGSCIVDVAGSNGARLSWKSTCGGYAYTVIDGNNDYAEFKCETPSIETTAQTPVEIVKEQVKCLFTNSNSEQKCGGDGFSCAGTGSCVAEVSGSKGKMLIWKSTCGGYAYTVIDGNNEYAEFNCQQAIPQATAIASTPMTTQPMPASEQICVDYDGDNYFLKSHVETGVDTFRHKDYDTCWVINSNTDYHDASECAGANCYVLENGCSELKTGKASAWKCPYDCKDGACIKREESKEQVSCVFANSNSEQKCYSDDGKSACSGVGSCTAGIMGEVGKKLTWKSTCGGYAYSVIDGSNENAEFNCIPAANVTQDQISGKGFKNVYWQCYDGKEGKSAVFGGPCKSSEIWQNDAQETCKNNCHTYDKDGITKCGVNTFSVSGECYLDEKEFFSPEIHGEKKIAMPPNSKAGDVILLYFYMDACTYCVGMDKELDIVSNAGIDVKRIDTASDAELARSYRLGGVPSLVALRYDKKGGIKEFTMTGKTDSSTILKWIGEIKGNTIPSDPTEEKREMKEEILICKDSCPLDGKCYPFGYRKSGRYCSDEGAFKDQLSGEMSCDNNFECSTNVCIDGTCVDSGMIKKMMDWFKKLF